MDGPRPVADYDAPLLALSRDSSWLCVVGLPHFDTGLSLSDSRVPVRSASFACLAALWHAVCLVGGSLLPAAPDVVHALVSLFHVFLLRLFFTNEAT